MSKIDLFENFACVNQRWMKLHAQDNDASSVLNYSRIIPLRNVKKIRNDS